MSDTTITFDLCVPRLVAVVHEVIPETGMATLRIVRDMHGRLYLVTPDTLADEQLASLRQRVHEALGPYSPGHNSGVVRCSDTLAGETLFAEPSLIQWVGDVGVRLIERRAMGQDWVNEPHASTEAHPPRFVFHSLKGGVGRSTAMMLWGRELVRQGRTVLLVDLDLEAPGLGSHMLRPDMRPEFGVLDWLVEDLVGNASAQLPAEMVAESLLVDSPGLWVAPAMGRRSGEYSQGVLAKLARGYLEGEDGSGFAQRLQRMVAALEAEVAPDVVLIDSRAGLHETVAGNLLHLGAEVFFFAVDVPATWEGYRYLLAHLAQLATVGEFENLEADWRQRFHMVHARSSLRDEDKRAFAAAAYAVWIDTLYDAVPPRDEEADEVSDQLLRFTFDEADPAAPHWPVSILRSEHFEAFDPLRQLASPRLANIAEAAIREAFGELFSELQACLQLREEAIQ